MSLDANKEAGSKSNQLSTAGLPSSAAEHKVSSDAPLSPSDAASSILAKGPSSAASTETPVSPSDSTIEASPSAPETSKEAQPASPVEDKISGKFAALVRKEKQTLARQQELKAEQAKLVTERAKMESELSSAKAELESQRKELDEFNQLKKMNKLKAMEKLGWTYQELTDIVLNEGKPTPEQLAEAAKAEMHAQLEAYKKEQEDRFKKDKEEVELSRKKASEDEKLRIEEERARVIQSFQGEIADFVGTNKDTYELTAINDPEGNIIYATVEKHFEDTGRVLSIKDATELVETWLEGQVNKNLATKKMKAKVSPPASQAAPKEELEAKSQSLSANHATAPKQTKTLSNDMTSASLSNLPAKSEQERIKRALAALDKLA